MLQILFAFAAGILTINAPCILPIIPIILGGSIGQKSKVRPLFIVAGFVLVFSVFALFISVITKSLGLNPNIIRTVGSIALGIFGLLLIWPKPFELLMLKCNNIFNKIGSLGDPTKVSNFSGLVLGMTLGVIWTPCAGPVLASILTLVALQKDIGVTAILLLAYSLGAGLPMLIIAYSGQIITDKITGLAKYATSLQKIFGVIVIGIAIATYLNYDIKLYSMILEHFPIFNPRL